MHFLESLNHSLILSLTFYNMKLMIGKITCISFIYFIICNQLFVIYLFNNAGSRGRDRIPCRWSARLSIARGIARALECLHINTTNSKSVVPHGNLKSTNVLLDWNGMVLISDRGLSSLIAQSIAAQNLVSYKPPGYHIPKRFLRSLMFGVMVAFC